PCVRVERHKVMYRYWWRLPQLLRTPRSSLLLLRLRSLCRLTAILRAKSDATSILTQSFAPVVRYAPRSASSSAPRSRRFTTECPYPAVIRPTRRVLGAAPCGMPPLIYLRQQASRRKSLAPLGNT